MFSAMLIGFAANSDLSLRAFWNGRVAEDAAEQDENVSAHSRQSNRSPSISSALAAAGDKVFALRADNVLLAFGDSSDTPVELPLASPPPSESFYGTRLIATSLDQSLLFVLVMSDAQSHQSLAVVDAGRMKLLKAYSLEGDVKFRGIAIGKRTGRIYLSGNQIRISRSPRMHPNNPDVGDPVVSVLDAEDGSIVHRWIPGLPDEFDWVVYQAEPTQDERHILVSYHGANTTGIDSFEVTQDELLRCKNRQNARCGCTFAHGAFFQMGDRLFAATGRPGILEYESGVLDRVFDTQLEGNHLMKFAVDRERQGIYAVGSCDYAGGLSVLKLSDGGQRANMNADGRSWQVLGNPVPKPQIFIKNREICGERIAVEDGSLIVVAQTHGPGSLDIPGGLLFLDGGTGRLISRFTSASHPIDAVIVHASHPDSKPH